MTLWQSPVDSLDSASDNIAQRTCFLPLLPGVSQQRQTRPISINECDAQPGARTFNEDRLDHGTDGHAKEHSFIPLLPDRRSLWPKQEFPSFGRVTASVSSRSSSDCTPSSVRSSHEHREQVAAPKNNGRLNRPKAVRRYEWPLIINGVYQGKGLLPSCRIEDNEPPTEPRPYAWPLIILHRAYSVEDCDQHSDPNDKEVRENTAERGEKVEADNENDRSIDESRTVDGVSAEC